MLTSPPGFVIFRERSPFTRYPLEAGWAPEPAWRNLLPPPGMKAKFLPAGDPVIAAERKYDLFYR
jgi:hypothetical protein